MAMTFKFLQLNIEKGRFIDSVLGFIKEESFDIVSLQEVAGGSLDYNGIDCFNIVKKKLDLQGEFGIVYKDIHDTNSYCGNATFFNKSLHLIKSELIWQKEFKEIDPKGFDFKNLSRSFLAVLLEVQGQKFWVVNAHLAWSPHSNDTDYKLAQAQKLFAYVKKLSPNFILSGDFNVSPASKIVSWFSTISKNLIVEQNIQNTLNPRTHVAKHLFPKGVAVDYIFPGNEIKVKKFNVIDQIDLSDHFGLSLEFEI